MSGVVVTVNGREQRVGAGAGDDGSVRALLAGRGLEARRGVAVAVNGAVVPREAWAERRLAPKDDVLIIRATQGG